MHNVLSIRLKEYSLFEFLQLVNQQSLYKLYDLKLPSDIGLFKIWKDKMQGVDIIMNTTIDKINIKNNIFLKKELIKPTKIYVNEILNLIQNNFQIQYNQSNLFHY